MKPSIANTLAAFYSVTEGAVTTAATYASFTAIQDTNNSTVAQRLPAFAFAGLAGVIETIATRNFQGEKLKQYLISNGNLSDFDDRDLEELLTRKPPSMSKQFFYMTAKIIYILCQLTKDTFESILIYAAFKNWILDAETNVMFSFLSITPFEAAVIFFYSALFKWPFSFSNVIAENCKKIRDLMGINWEHAADTKLIKAFADKFQWLAKSLPRNFIVFSGATALTLEQSLSPITLIPPPWVAKFFSSSPQVFWPITILIALGYPIVAFPILAQNFYFEGQCSADNLNLLARPNLQQYDNHRQPLIDPRIATVLFYLLYLAGPLNALDRIFDVYEALNEYLPLPVIAPILLTVGIIVGLGNHFSEVKESQASVRKLTKPHEAEITQRKPTNYGTLSTRNPDYKNFPAKKEFPTFLVTLGKNSRPAQSLENVGLIATP